jgi:hypothetical protein
LLIGISLGPPAWAHPTGDRLPAQLLEVDVTAAALGITLTAEAPDALWAVLGEGHDDPIAHVERTLPNGVYVEIDGVRAPLTGASVERGADLVTGHATWIVARWTIPAVLFGRHTVRVGNATFPDRPSWFRDEVRVPAGSVVHATNLSREVRGRRVELADRWLRSESLRRVDLDVEIGSGPLARAFAATAPRPWTVEEARPVPLLVAWRTGRDDPWTVTLAAGVAALLGAAAARAAGPAWAVAATAVAGVAAWLGVPPAFAAIGVGIGGTLAVLRPSLAPAGCLLAAGWCGAAAGTPWIAAPIAGCAAGATVGALGARRPRAAGVVLLALAVVAGLRGG